MNRKEQEELYQRWLKGDDVEPPDELLELCEEDAQAIALTPEEQAQAQAIGNGLSTYPSSLEVIGLHS